MMAILPDNFEIYYELERYGKIQSIWLQKYPKSWGGVLVFRGWTREAQQQLYSRKPFRYAMARFRVIIFNCFFFFSLLVAVF